MNEADNFALVPRPPGALEKAEPGAKRILSGMVTDTLALVKKEPLPGSEKSEINSSQDVLNGSDAEMPPVAADADLESWCQKGVSYYYGRGVPENKSEGAKWFRMAAERGHARAQCWLADFYLWNPHGMLQAYSEAVKWLRKAAEQGFDHGQNELGECYHTGLAIPQDYSEAVRWFRKAAAQSHPRGQLNLGQCYRDGHGVVRDRCEAFKWFKLAANNPASEAYKWFDLPDPRSAQLGREYAAEELAALSSRMSPDELAEGERRYRELLSGETLSK
jgi:tetratricopeptide (TPR) repeat protein